MTTDTIQLTTMPDADTDRVQAVLDAIIRTVPADDTDRRMLGLRDPEAWAPPDAIEQLDNIIRAAMLSAKNRRRSYAQAVEKHYQGNQAITDAVPRFMSLMSRKLDQPKQEFLELVQQLANATPEHPEDFPEARWRRAMHETLLNALEIQRNDAAVELCIASWNSALMEPGRVDAYQLKIAQTMVAYGRADELLRITSRAVCRMEIMSRLNINPMKMLNMRNMLQQRLPDDGWQSASNVPELARRLISMVALERLETAVQRPESENPKDGLLASYCEEVHENLPRSRP